MSFLLPFYIISPCKKFAGNGLQIRRYFKLDFKVTAFCWANFWTLRPKSSLKKPFRTKISPLTILQDLKDKIRKERGYPVEIQRLYHKNEELQDQVILSDLIARSTHCPDKYLMGKSIKAKQLIKSNSF